MGVMLPAKVIDPAREARMVPPPPDVIEMAPRMMLLPDSLAMVPSLVPSRKVLLPSLLVVKEIVAGRSITRAAAGSRWMESLPVLVAAVIVLVPAPNEALLVPISQPLLTVALPVKVLTPDRVRLPAPVFVRVPAPEMIAGSVTS